MINLASIVSDPDFAQALTVTRSNGGSWQLGNWINNTESINWFGIVQPSTPEELEQVPEGDRVKGAMSFHSEQVIYETHTDGPTDPNAGISDLITWQNQIYRIVKVFPWEDFGYYKAIGVRKSGQ
jgi:hypothetical protein